MRPRSILALALPCALACGASPTVGGRGRPPPRKVEPDEHAVTIRNNCPESVTLHLGMSAPGPNDELIELSGSGIEQRKLGKRARVWLRYRDEWSRRRSAAANDDGWVLEIIGSCDGVSSRPGPL
jgi:hypothetical protein